MGLRSEPVGTREGRFNDINRHGARPAGSHPMTDCGRRHRDRQSSGADIWYDAASVNSGCSAKHAEERTL
jgi:hypothetical protein